MNVYYSVQNCGDGSAYPMFLTSQKLADWDQEHMEEGWGESCTGSLTILFPTLVDGDVVVVEMLDEIGYWLLRTEDFGDEPWDLRDEFLADFFLDGLPRFVVRIRLDAPYYDILVGGVVKGERFGYNDETKKTETTEAGRAALEERLNA